MLNPIQFPIAQEAQRQGGTVSSQIKKYIEHHNQIFSWHVGVVRSQHQVPKTRFILLDSLDKNDFKSICFQTLSIIFLEQAVYIEDQFVGEGGRLISNILSITNNLKIKFYLKKMDVEKTFD